MRSSFESRRLRRCSPSRCGLSVTLTAALTSYDHRFRYVTEALGLLVVVLAFAVHPLGSATFWHNGIMGISTVAAAFADRGPLAERYERDLHPA